MQGIFDSQNILTDDAGFETSVYGNSECKTPNLNKLSKKSLIFDQAFTSVSSCSPSRASILTGLPSHQNGVSGLYQGVHHFLAYDRVLSLPNILKKNGIATGIIGKKHVGPKNVFAFEFEETEENHSILQIGRNITYIKLLIRKFFETYGNRSFFLYVGFHDPHRCGHTHPQFGSFCEFFGNGEPNMGIIPDWTPFHYEISKVKVPYFIQDTLATRGDIVSQYVAISRLDQGIGLVLKELSKAGYDKNTLIIYTSDNGIPFAVGRTNFYDPGIREPFLISSPFHSNSWGKHSKAIITNLDIMPTILDWFQLKYPINYILRKDEITHLTGRSLLQFLEDPILKDDKQKIFGSHNLHEITMYYPMRYVRTNKYKLIHNLNFKMPFPVDQDLYLSPSFQDLLERDDNQIPSYWYRNLSMFYYRPQWELYELISDPYELINLATVSSHEQILRDLKKELKNWQWYTFDPWICSPDGILEDTGFYKDDPHCFSLSNHINNKK